MRYTASMKTARAALARIAVLDSYATSMWNQGLLSRARRADNLIDDLRVRLWRMGECCGCLGPDSRCRSRVVELARLETLQEGGMGRMSRREMSQLCDKSELWKTIETASRIGRDLGLRVGDVARAIQTGDTSDE